MAIYLPNSRRHARRDFVETPGMLRDSFSGSDLEAGVRTFFDALIEILTGAGKEH